MCRWCGEVFIDFIFTADWSSASSVSISTAVLQFSRTRGVLVEPGMDSTLCCTTQLNGDLGAGAALPVGEAFNLFSQLDVPLEDTGAGSAGRRN